MKSIDIISALKNTPNQLAEMLPELYNTLNALDPSMTMEVNINVLSAAIDSLGYATMNGTELQVRIYSDDKDDFVKIIGAFENLHSLPAGTLIYPECILTHSMAGVIVK